MKPSALLKNTLIFCVSACILCSCTAKRGENAFTPQLDPAYSVQADMTYADGQQAALTLTRSGAGCWDAEFSEPAALSGVLLTFDGDAVSASYKGLAFTVPKSAMPAKNMLVAATEILDGLDGIAQLPCSATDDGTWISTGESAAGSYTVSFTDSGELCALEIPSQPLTVTFSGYAVVSAPAETDLTAALTDITDTSSVTSDTTETTASAENSVDSTKNGDTSD